MNMLRKSVGVSGLGLFLISLLWVAQNLAAAPALTRTHAGGGVTAKATYLNPGGTEDTRFRSHSTLTRWIWTVMISRRWARSR